MTCRGSAGVMAVILFAACDAGSLEDPADGHRVGYRTDSNGLSLNGAMLNGLGKNGLLLNGYRLNGYRLNGYRFNGLSINGLSEPESANLMKYLVGCALPAGRSVT